MANDTVVCVAGQIDEDRMIKKIEKLFSEITESEQPDFEKVIEGQKSSGLKIKNKTELIKLLKQLDINYGI